MNREHQGKTFACKKCGAAIQVPLAPETEAPPPLPPTGPVDLGGGTPVLRRDATVYGEKAAEEAPAAGGGAQQRRPKSPVGRQPARKAKQAKPHLSPAPQPAGQQGPSQPQVKRPRLPGAGGQKPATQVMSRGQAQAAVVQPAPQRQLPQAGQKRATRSLAPQALQGRRGQTRAGAQAASGTRRLPGALPVRKKKSNTTLILLLSGGGVVLVGLIVVIAVFARGDSDSPVGPGGIESQLSAEEKREERLKQQRAKLQKAREWLSSPINAMNYSELWQRYVNYSNLDSFVLEAELESEREDLLSRVAEKLGRAATPDVSLATHRKIAERLEEDGYADAAREIAAVVCGKDAPYKRFKTVALEGGRKKTEADPDYLAIEAIGGYVYYKEPEVFESYDFIFGFEVYREYRKKVREIEIDYRELVLPPEEAKQISRYEQALREKAEEIESDHEKDGFAKYAAKAFTRFRNSYRNTLFKGEWTYHYSAPFVYYLELEGNDRSPKEIAESLETKEKILKDLVEYFNTNYRDIWGLERQYPNVSNEEEKNRWPLEIVVLRDGERYQEYGDDAMDGGIPPGARAHYSPQTRQIITWDDPKSLSDDASRWFDVSVITHEAWHFLSGIHLPDPMSQTFKNDKGQNIPFPTYCSILIQEGLTDFVAGFETDGDNYRFGKLNHLRLQNFQAITEQITAAWKQAPEVWKQLNQEYPGRQWEEGKYASLFDLRGMVQTLTYGHAGWVAQRHMQSLGLHWNPGIMNFAGGAASGFFYAASCQASYFFHYFEGGKYRDQFLEWCRRDYTAETTKVLDWDDLEENQYENTPGLLAFMDIFGIDSFDDEAWQELNDEFMQYVVEELEPLDVGKGYELPELEGDGDGLPEGLEGYSYSFEAFSQAQFQALKAVIYGEAENYQALFEKLLTPRSAFKPARLSNYSRDSKQEGGGSPYSSPLAFMYAYRRFYADLSRLGLRWLK